MNQKRNDVDIKRTSFPAFGFLVGSRYEIQEVLGHGTYGMVCSAIDKVEPSSPAIAIKRINNITRDIVLLRRAVRELKLMRHLRGHANVYLDLVDSKPYHGLYCYQELMDCDLSKIIRSSIQFTEIHIQSFIYKILCAVKYIHSANILHRDLKPGNILVNSIGELKICDFGLARSYRDSSTRPRSSLTGGSDEEFKITHYVATRWYRAPELMMNYENYSKAIDIWAVGCIFAEMLGRVPLFRGKNQAHQMMEISRVLGRPTDADLDRIATPLSRNFFDIIKHPKGSKAKATNGISFAHLYPEASTIAHDLLSRMLKYNPDKRATASELLEHRYVELFRQSYNKGSEPVCPKWMDDSFEKASYDQLEVILRQEVELFRKEVRVSSQPQPLSTARIASGTLTNRISYSHERQNYRPNTASSFNQPSNSNKVQYQAMPPRRVQSQSQSRSQATLPMRHHSFQQRALHRAET
ncbi:kinase-like protein [Nadsonia fulvescens var. elongata DSM 6958]|uniref:Kinase-like protein n=1 Tax=Nadsonia fulvescens var. elongata DSM 6958 TaxID=857566 RepID=A0A1E3PQB8_9ASCO|nr:kinase-like protein [Nadsonia fulvescens var. elongata DSM 6958]